ncbi:MAG: sigma-70 family RNA polymerase sigma factor [Clostridia bacterium]|nr:sigma-70 family RNA polymerase sigma factor [Clostridia bacterium]
MSNYKNMEISELLEAIKKGEGRDEAFSALEERYMPLMQKRVAQYFAASGSTSEAMQEARIALHSAALSYDADKSGTVTFGLYAGICIANRLKSMLRESARRSERETPYSETERIASGVDLESFIAARDLCARVMDVARSVLSEFEYEVFRLSFEQYTTKDIAGKLQREPKAVDNAKFRISSRLRDNERIRDILSDI